VQILIRILSVVALMISMGWLYFEPGFEPVLTTVVSLSALISTFIFGNKPEAATGQNQTIHENSAGIQAGGNVSININDANKEK
jgi:multisubunit Na+/H+ antiporter MnhB subunit